MYTRTQEKLETTCERTDFIANYNFNTVCRDFVAKWVEPIIPINTETNEIEINENDRYELLNKLSIIKNGLDYTAVTSGNDIAIECNIIILDLMSFLKMNDIKGFTDFVKKLLA
jgi:hypothetical protein